MELFRIIPVLLLPLLVACSELQTFRDSVINVEDGPVVAADEGAGLHGWLADMHQLRTRSPESLPAVLEAREEAFRSWPGFENRMRLVMVLLVSDESVRDEKRARLLLNRLDPLPSSAGDREFVSLLKQFLDEQQEYRQKLSVLWKQVTYQNRRIDELEQQLKALTSIEQNIQQREPTQVIEDGK